MHLPSAGVFYMTSSMVVDRIAVNGGVSFPRTFADLEACDEDEAPILKLVEI